MRTTDNTTYVSRPRSKPSASTRGKLNEWENGYKEFVPMGTKESNRVMKKQLGPSSFYKTEGQKESSYTVHINVDGSSEDPVADAFEVFKALTESERKQKPLLATGPQGRMLLDNGQGLQIWLDTEHRKVSIMAELDCGAQIERQLLQAQSVMSVTVGRYRQEIIKA